MKTYLAGPKIYTADGTAEVCLEWVDGKITGIYQQAPTAQADFYFPADCHLIPGMIDMHIHGAQGADVMDATESALATLSQALPKEGCTGFLATTMTEAPEKIQAALTAIKQFSSHPQGATILGVHLEGPFLAPKRMGAQCGEYICEANVELFKQWQQASGNKIKLVTVAPEIPHALDLIKYLRSQNILASLGHSDATFAEANAGIEAGASYATHLFNAMRGIHHREPGIATALLLDDRISAELILDGHHLHPGIVQLALKVKGKQRIVLVSDAMRAKCCGEGRFELGGQAVIVQNGAATLENGTLAGSVLSLNQALKYLLQHTDSSLEDAIALTSTNPAKLLGLPHKGSIALGQDADFTVLNAQYEVLATFIAGKLVYKK